MAAKSSTLSHVSFLMSMMRTKSTRALSFSFYQHFAVQNDQLRLKSSKTVLKAFQLIFPWLKMKWKTLCISDLDSWVDQKKHLNKDAQKKMFMKWRCAMTSFDFSFFSCYFLVVQKVEFSYPVQYSTSPKYPCFPDLLYSSYIVCMVDGKNIVLVPARM